MDINSHVLKLSGTAEIEAPLEHAKTYAVGIEIEVEDGGLKNNQDGTHDKIWKGRLIRAVIQTATRKIYTKDTGSQSQKLRRAIRKLTPEGMEEDAFYNYVMGGIRHNIDSIIDLIEKWDQETIN